MSATATATPGIASPAVDDGRIVEALRRGDEPAFAELIDTYGASMLAIAQRYVRTRAIAQEVVQDTWLSVIKGIDRFEARSSLKTWVFRILINQAKSRGVRESRSVPFSALEGDASEPAVEADRFLDQNHDRWPGHWAAYPSSWNQLPEQRLMARETLDCVREAIEQLPERQRAVVVMRDIEGWSPEEVCGTLEITDANQRILLHRARSKVRRALERYFDGE